MILALKTAGETSELYLLKGGSDSKPNVVNENKWQAGRELAKTLLVKIEELLDGRSFNEIDGLIVFTGPGSFTGLRIGITTVNTIAYSENIPIVGVSGNNWLEEGLKKLNNGEHDNIVTPNYGAEPNITIKKTK